jgi:hypothetical protein
MFSLTLEQEIPKALKHLLPEAFCEEKKMINKTKIILQIKNTGNSIKLDKQYSGSYTVRNVKVMMQFGSGFTGLEIKNTLKNGID